MEASRLLQIIQIVSFFFHAFFLEKKFVMVPFGGVSFGLLLLSGLVVPSFGRLDSTLEAGEKKDSMVGAVLVRFAVLLLIEDVLTKGVLEVFVVQLLLLANMD